MYKYNAKSMGYNLIALEESTVGALIEVGAMAQQVVGRNNI